MSDVNERYETYDRCVVCCADLPKRHVRPGWHNDGPMDCDKCYTTEDGNPRLIGMPIPMAEWFGRPGGTTVTGHSHTPPVIQGPYNLGTSQLSWHQPTWRREERA